MGAIRLGTAPGVMTEDGAYSSPEDNNPCGALSIFEGDRTLPFCAVTKTHPFHLLSLPYPRNPRMAKLIKISTRPEAPIGSWRLSQDSPLRLQSLQSDTDRSSSIFPAFNSARVLVGLFSWMGDAFVGSRPL